MERLQHFEGRSFRGWHHLTLVSAAHAYRLLRELAAVADLAGCHGPGPAASGRGRAGWPPGTPEANTEDTSS